MIETVPSRARPVAPRAYLLVCDGDRARVVDLPVDGAITIGRSSECGVVLADDEVSREHAKIVMIGGRGLIEDCGSANGTRVGGSTITKHELSTGDVIELGVARLVFYTSAQSGPRTLELADFMRAVEHEIERTRISKRGFAVLSIRAPGDLRALVAGNLRVFELASAGEPGEVLVLCPELDDDPATFARELCAIASVHGPASAGAAVCPHDGLTANQLVAAARDAAHTGRPRERAKVLAIGELEVVVAEPATVQLYQLVERLARSELPVLLRGETGTGKEVVARALHAWSKRAAAPFVAINCAALPEQLAESELFGHERGAFSGATTSKPGLLETARGGTVLLDEIGDMSLATQAKLLRALETKRVLRLGSVEERAIDIRLVAATHRDLDADVASGRFRRDLLFRLDGGTIAIPPLRDRPRELVLLAEMFLGQACRELERERQLLSDDAVLELANHAWPGNVRELRHVMHYLAAAVERRTIVAPDVRARIAARGGEPAPAATASTANLRDEIAALERRRIVEAMTAHDHHQARAAASLGMPLRTFVAKLKRYQIKK